MNFFDIVKDLYELNNLTNNPQYNDVLIDVKSRLKRIRNATNDVLPTIRA